MTPRDNKKPRCQPRWGGCDLRDGHKGNHWSSGKPRKLEHDYWPTTGRRDFCSTLVSDDESLLARCGARKRDHEATR